MQRVPIRSMSNHLTEFVNQQPASTISFMKDSQNIKVPILNCEVKVRQTNRMRSFLDSARNIDLEHWDVQVGV